MEASTVQLYTFPTGACQYICMRKYPFATLHKKVLLHNLYPLLLENRCGREAANCGGLLYHATLFDHPFGFHSKHYYL